jgi:hypothetical protein
LEFTVAEAVGRLLGVMFLIHLLPVPIWLGFQWLRRAANP